MLYSIAVIFVFLIFNDAIFKDILALPENRLKDGYTNPFYLEGENISGVTSTSDLLGLNASRSPCGIRDRASGSLRDHKIIVTVSMEYMPIFYNWMIFYLHICPNRDNLVIICVNEETSNAISKHGLTCLLDLSLSETQSKSNLREVISTQASGQVQMKDQENIWKVRVGLAKGFLDDGFDVLLSDIDAFWLSNPYSAIGLYDSDIVASRAQFPKVVYDLYGATLCMGFVYIRSNNNTKYLWKKFYKAMKVISRSDDQDILNKLIFLDGRIHFPDQKLTINREIESRRSNGKGYFWNSTLKSYIRAEFRKYTPLDYENSFAADTGLFRYRHQEARLTLLAHNHFQRVCEMDSGRISSSMEAIIAHCNGPKRGSAKESVFRGHRIWLLHSNYSSGVYSRNSSSGRSSKSNTDSASENGNVASSTSFEEYLVSVYSKELFDLFKSQQNTYLRKYANQ